jgi:hypothetical protein
VNVLLFGATGMVGQGVLRECLLAPDVERVQTVGRSAAAYAVRPGLTQPLHGVTSRTPLYRLFYIAAAPLVPLARRLFPNTIVTTEQVGKAMVNVARRGWPTPILEQRDIARASE